MLMIGVQLWRRGLCSLCAWLWRSCQKKRNTGIGIHAHTVTKRTSVSWQMKVGYTGKNYHCSRFLLLNLGDYSRRCERNFCSNLGIIKVRYKPTHHSVVEFRNISLSIAKIVRQLFELADWRRLISSSSSVSSMYVNLVNCLKASRLIIQYSAWKYQDSWWKIRSHQGKLRGERLPWD